MIYAFFLFVFVQKSFLTKTFFLYVEINLTTRGPLYTCLVVLAEDIECCSDSRRILKGTLNRGIDPVSHEKIEWFHVSHRISLSYLVSIGCLLYLYLVLHNNSISNRQKRSHLVFCVTPQGTPGKYWIEMFRKTR